MKPGPHYAEHIKRAVRQLICIGLGGIAIVLTIIAITFSL